MKLNGVISLSVLCLAALPCLAETETCDLVSLSIDNSQFDPAGAFVGNTVLTFLEVDPATGSIFPTGESRTITCSVTLMSLLPEFDYVTTHECVGGRGSRIEFTSVHEGQFLPIEGDPDFDFGVLDTGTIITGKGRWNCGSDALGLNPVTGGFNAKARLWSPSLPGSFVGTGLAQWCSCKGG
jgi:hypothetical protein